MSFAFNFADDDTDMEDSTPGTPQVPSSPTTASFSTARPAQLSRPPSITIMDAPKDESEGKAPPVEVKVKIEKLSDMVGLAWRASLV